MPKPNLSDINEFPILENPLNMPMGKKNGYKLPAQLTQSKLDQLKLYSTTNLKCAFYYAMSRFIQHESNGDIGTHVEASFEVLNNFLNVYKMAPNSTEAKESIKLALQIANQYGSYQHFNILEKLSNIDLAKKDENYKGLKDKLKFVNSVLDNNPSNLKKIIPLTESQKPSTVWSKGEYSTKSPTSDVLKSQDRPQFGSRK